MTNLGRRPQSSETEEVSKFGGTSQVCSVPKPPPSERGKALVTPLEKLCLEVRCRKVGMPMGGNAAAALGRRRNSQQLNSAPSPKREGPSQFLLSASVDLFQSVCHRPRAAATVPAPQHGSQPRSGPGPGPTCLASIVVTLRTTPPHPHCPAASPCPGLERPAPGEENPLLFCKTPPRGHPWGGNLG